MSWAQTPVKTLIEEAVGFDAANSRGTTVQSGINKLKTDPPVSLGTATHGGTGLTLIQNGNNATVVHCVDLMIDVGGTQYVVVENLIFQRTRSIRNMLSCYIPLRIPPGADIYIRTSNGSSNSNRSMNVGVIIHTGTDVGYSATETIGVTSGEYPQGTIVTADATTHTKGPTSSLGVITYDWAEFMLMFHVENSSALTSTLILMDVMIDTAGGTPIEIISEYTYGKDSSGDESGPQFARIQCPVPAGSSIGLAIQSDVASANLYAGALGMVA